MCVSNFIKLKLFVPAGRLALVPPFGPILGQYGINTTQLCKEFNERTESLVFFFSDGVSASFSFLLSVDIYIYEDKTFSFIVNKPSASFLLRLLTDTRVGASDKVVKVFLLKEFVFLAQFKFPKMNLRNACTILVGTARSIGIIVR